MRWLAKKIGVEAKPVFPDVRLNGFRVIVRQPNIRDWPSWAAVREQNKKYLKPLEPRWPEDSLSRDFFLRRLSKQCRDWKEGRGYSFLIITKEHSRLIGGVNINHVCRGAAQSGSLGYWLDRDHQGQGYMAESLRLVIAYAFKDLKLRRLNAACLPENQRSRNLLLKLGFEKEGFAKSYLQINEKWQDHVLFGLVKPD